VVLNPDQKKILLIYDVSYPSIEGGGQRRLWEVGRRLSTQGFQVDWVCFKTWADESTVQDHGISYIGLSGFRGLYKRNGKRRVLETLEFAKALFLSKLDFKKYDYVWSGQWPIIHLLWWFIRPSSLGNTKLIVDWWEIWERTWFSYSKSVGFVGYLLEKILIKRLSHFAHLVLVSPEAIRKAKRMAPKGSFSLIHNGVDVKEIRNVEPSVECSDVIYLGRLKDHKRVDLLIQAMPFCSLT
jgi:glycosyltransferase involved in cell wall biosynthesis